MVDCEELTTVDRQRAL